MVLPDHGRTTACDQLALKDASHNEAFLIMRQYVISEDGKAWVSQSRLRNRRGDRSQSFPTYVISLNYPVRSTPILPVVKTVRILNSCRIVAFSCLALPRPQPCQASVPVRSCPVH